MLQRSLFIAALALSSCGIVYWPDNVETGFENAETQNDSLWITIGGEHIYSAATIDSLAFAGDQSLYIQNQGEVGFEYIHHNPEPDAKYYLTVWCKSSGKHNRAVVVAMAQTEDGLVEIVRSSLAADVQRGWEKRELLVQLPPTAETKAVHFRLLNDGDDPVWFDEFDLEFLEKVYYPEFDDEETLEIRMSEPDLERLREKRKGAFAKGYMDMGRDDWIRVDVIWGDSVRTGNLTLKGDKLKNLEGDKWSMKIELDDKTTVMGMNYFSIHNPELRSFIDEWMFHEVLQTSGVVCPNYGFVPVTLNGRSLGVYAFEERIMDEYFVHSDSVNAIARYKDLKYAKVLADENQGGEVDNRSFEEANIQIYRQEAFDKARKEHFKEGVNEFRNLSPDAVNYFNKEQSARFLALCDLMQAYYGLHWTNIRFVYDLGQSKIQWAGNDGYGDGLIDVSFNKPFMAWYGDAPLAESIRWKAAYLNFFNDAEFMARYLEALREFSSERHMNIIKLNTLGEMRYYQSILEKEWPGYQYSYGALYDSGRAIQKSIDGFEERHRNTGGVYRFAP